MGWVLCSVAIARSTNSSANGITNDFWTADVFRHDKSGAAFPDEAKSVPIAAVFVVQGAFDSCPIVGASLALCSARRASGHRGDCGAARQQKVFGIV